MTREQIIEQLDSIVGTYEILLGNEYTRQEKPLNSSWFMDSH